MKGLCIASAPNNFALMPMLGRGIDSFEKNQLSKAIILECEKIIGKDFIPTGPIIDQNLSDFVESSKTTFGMKIGSVIEGVETLVEFEGPIPMGETPDSMLQKLISTHEDQTGIKPQMLLPIDDNLLESEGNGFDLVNEVNRTIEDIPYYLEFDKN